MKRTWQRATALVAAAVLSGGLLAGCGQQTVQVQSNSTDKAELYTVKYLCAPMDIAKSGETPVGKYIKEKFNIEFEFIPYAGDMKEKQSLMLAGGDYNELQLLQGDDMVKNYNASSALLDLDGYKAQLPDFNERFKNEIPYWRIVGDGKLIKYETKTPLRYTSNMEVNDIAVRTDALEAQGWPVLVTADDWVKFLEKAVKNAPEVNGQKPVGITAPFAESFGLAGIVQILYEKGDTYIEVSDDCNLYNVKTKQFEDQFKNKYVKESLSFMNTLYRKGLLDAECFTDTADKTQEKMAQGLPIAVWYTQWYKTAANSELIKGGKEKMTYINMPIMANSQAAEGQKRVIRTETTRSFNSHGITKNAKYPARLAELINWSCTDEGQNIIRCGIEGDTWKKDATGKRIPTEAGIAARKDAKLKTSSGMDLFYGILPSFNLTAADGQYHNIFLTPEVVKQIGVKPRLAEAYAALGWVDSQTWFKENAFFGETGLSGTVTLDGTTDMGKTAHKMVEVRVKYEPKMIMAKDDAEFEKIYAEAMAEYEKLNPKAVIDEYNRLLAEAEVKLASYK